jgi:poly(3-hydroxybutyrate) depolymerase
VSQRPIHGGALLAALCLTACGGSGSGVMPGPGSPGRGALLQSPPKLVSTLTTGDLLLELSVIANQPLLALSGTPLCDIAVYHLEYATVGANSEATTASGALMVPTGVDARCRGDRPMLLYAHGTSTNRAFNIADLKDAQNAEGLLLAALFAAQGYIVVAPNYAGFDTSTLSYHAYLNADQQSKDMIDALSAARLAMPAAGVLITRDSGKLFITGYSQGGYVAMATQRAMQLAGMTVTAAAPMSGPYALAAFFDAVVAGQVDGGAPVFTTLLITGYQNAYGNIYAHTTDVFEAQYAGGIESLLPGLIPRSELYSQGKLPQYALFSATPPDPIYADITPATQPAYLAPVFALGFGSGNLLTNSYRLSYLLDAASHPDGGWPVVTTGAPVVGPARALRQALALNDLRNWAPVAPTLLCGGNGDPIVFWLNTQLIQNYWSSRQPTVTGFNVLDIDSSASVADPYVALKGSFALAKQAVALAAIAQGATDGGQRAVFEAYHATLVAPFCLAAVRAFFASQ